MQVRGIPIENGNKHVLFITRRNPRNDPTYEEGYVWLMLIVLIAVKTRPYRRILVKVILLERRNLRDIVKLFLLQDVCVF